MSERIVWMQILLFPEAGMTLLSSLLCPCLKIEAGRRRASLRRWGQVSAPQCSPPIKAYRQPLEGQEAKAPWPLHSPFPLGSQASLPLPILLPHTLVTAVTINH